MSENGECAHDQWIPTTTDFETVRWNGDPIVLHNVPGQSCPLCGKTIVEADEVIRAEQRLTAVELGLSEREGNIVLFLFAPGPRFTEPGYIEEKYRFNKMLFKFWKELETKGFGQAFIHDAFKAEKRGPVPENLIPDSKSLEKKGLVKVRWGGRVVARSYKWELTDKGRTLAGQLFGLTPGVVQEAVTRTKADLFLLDSTQLMHKIHEEYPEYRKVYAQKDEE